MARKRKAPDNLCLTVPLAPPGPPQYVPPSLLDLLQHVDLSKMALAMTDPLKTLPPLSVNPTALKPAYRKPSWALADNIQAQSRLFRSHHLSPVHYIAPNNQGAFDMKALDVMRKKIDDDIHKAMFGVHADMIKYPSQTDPYGRHRLQERRRYPDFEEGLREGLENDVRAGLKFGEVVHEQRAYEPEMIRRWIWGPNKEFTGYPAGDVAFDETWRENHGDEQGTFVAELGEFRKTLGVNFRFTARFTRRDMRSDPHSQDAYYFMKNRGRADFMIQFETYEDQHRWAEVARRAADEQMSIQGRQHHGY